MSLLLLFFPKHPPDLMGGFSAAVDPRLTISPVHAVDRRFFSGCAVVKYLPFVSVHPEPRGAVIPGLPRLPHVLFVRVLALIASYGRVCTVPLNPPALMCMLYFFFFLSPALFPSLCPNESSSRLLILSPPGLPSLRLISLCFAVIMPGCRGLLFMRFVDFRADPYSASIPSSLFPLDFFFLSSSKGLSLSNCSGAAPFLSHSAGKPTLKSFPPVHLTVPPFFPGVDS